MPIQASGLWCFEWVEDFGYLMGRARSALIDGARAVL